MRFATRWPASPESWRSSGAICPPTPPAVGVLGEVRHEVVHINKIVSELLEIARPKPPVFQPGDLVAVAEHASLFARDQAAAQHVTLEVVKDETAPGAGVR